VIDELRSRIRGMQKRSLEARVLPTSSALADLLPGGALAAGSSYAVENSTTLALEMLAGPSGAGSWCAIVGMPDLGAEAAAEAGIDLARLVLVPHPGDQWMAVVSALVDVIPVVLVNPPMRDGRARVNDAAASRMAARLRQREAVLIGVGDWPGAEARLRVAESGWSGIGAGFGRLAARRVTVASASAAWAGRGRSRRLWMPGADGRVAAVTPWGAEEAAGPGVAGSGAAGSGVVPLSAAG
jgi:hypothetical protein